MSFDPKKDPNRRCRPVEAWPIRDRVAWEAALAEGDVLEAGGGGSGWSYHSRRKSSAGYGRWLTWLENRGLLDLDDEPAARVIPERVREYIRDLRKAQNAPYTVLARVQELYHAIRVMAPDRDWAWLRAIENRVRHGVSSVRNKRVHVVPAESLVAFGIELMRAADDADGGTALQRARRYRDGLQIALLATRPLRRRNFAGIELGRHLLKEGDAQWLCFAANETKTGEPIEVPLPGTLGAYLEGYLTRYRPVLMARDGRWRKRSASSASTTNALWISDHGSRMTEIAIYFRIIKLTTKRFGHPVNPHLFRDSAATSVAVEDPEHVHIIRSILGHTTLKSGERYYTHARSLEASRRYQAQILRVRQRLNIRGGT